MIKKKKTARGKKKTNFHFILVHLLFTTVIGVVAALMFQSADL